MATSSAHTGAVDGSGVTPGTDLAAEVARLRAERDAALAALNREGRRRSRWARVRQLGVGVLVLLFAILLPVTVAATWAHRTVLNTGAYVATITPIAQDPAVTAAVSRRVTNEVYAALNPQQILADALPPKAAPLAGPLSNAVKGYLQDGVNTLLNSPRFQELWVSANTFAHAQLVSVLRGDSTALQTTNGQVVLNLVPLVNEVLKKVQTEASALVGRNITLPTVSGTELPSVACAKIAAALDRPVPATCGQVPLFPADKLTNAQRAVRAFDGAVLALLIVTPLVAVAALWLSRRRRRTLVQLVIGGLLGLVVVRRLTMWLQAQLIDQARPENANAVSAIIHDVLRGLFTVTAWFLVGGLVLLVLALLTGPYRWAVAMRSWTANAARGAGRLVSAATRSARGDSTVSWVRAHLDLLRIAGVVLAALVVLLADVSWVGLLIVALALAGYELWLFRLRSAEPASPPSASVPVPPA